MKKIGIEFGDNDFHSCFTGVLEVLYNTSKSSESNESRGSFEDLTKEQICIIVNQISYGMYLLYQNKFTYNIEKNNVVDESLIEYLKIKPESILFDKEVDEYANSGKFLNGEAFFVDLNTGYTWSL